jgi:thioesterase domain-containing protein
VLANLDAYPPSRHDLDGDEQAMLRWVLDLVGHDGAEFAGRDLTPRDIAEVVRQDGNPLAELGEERVLAMIDVMKVHSRFSSEYAPSRFGGKMLLFAATADMAEEDLVERAGLWTPHTAGEVEVHRLPGTHDHMMNPGQLARIGAVVAAELVRVDQELSEDGES